MTVNTFNFDLADRLDAARQLVHAIELATSAACEDARSRDAMAELDLEVQSRLDAISAELRAVQ